MPCHRWSKVPPRPLTPRSPKSTVPLGWLPPLNCKLHYYSMALGWISHRLRPKVNGTVELDTTLKCTPLPNVNATVGLDFTPLPSQRQRQCWVCFAVTTPPKLSLHGVLILKCMHHLMLPSWMHVLYFLNSTQNRP